MARIEVKCTVCGGVEVIKHGISKSGNQRYYCKDVGWKWKRFQLEHTYTGCKVGIKEKNIAVAANASVIRAPNAYWAFFLKSGVHFEK